MMAGLGVSAQLSPQVQLPVLAPQSDVQYGPLGAAQTYADTLKREAKDNPLGFSAQWPKLAKDTFFEIQNKIDAACQLLEKLPANMELYQLLFSKTHFEDIIALHQLGAINLANGFSSFVQQAESKHPHGPNAAEYFCAHWNELLNEPIDGSNDHWHGGLKGTFASVDHVSDCNDQSQTMSVNRPSNLIEPRTAIKAFKKIGLLTELTKAPQKRIGHKATCLELALTGELQSPTKNADLIIALVEEGNLNGLDAFGEPLQSFMQKYPVLVAHMDAVLKIMAVQHFEEKINQIKVELSLISDLSFFQKSLNFFYIGKKLRSLLCKSLQMDNPFALKMILDVLKEFSMAIQLPSLFKSNYLSWLFWSLGARLEFGCAKFLINNDYPDPIDLQIQRLFKDSGSSDSSFLWFGNSDRLEFFKKLGHEFNELGGFQRLKKEYLNTIDLDQEKKQLSDVDSKLDELCKANLFLCDGITIESAKNEFRDLIKKINNFLILKKFSVGVVLPEDEKNQLFECFHVGDNTTDSTVSHSLISELDQIRCADRFGVLDNIGNLDEVDSNSFNDFFSKLNLFEKTDCQKIEVVVKNFVEFTSQRNLIYGKMEALNGQSSLLDRFDQDFSYNVRNFELMVDGDICLTDSNKALLHGFLKFSQRRMSHAGLLFSAMLSGSVAGDLVDPANALLLAGEPNHENGQTVPMPTRLPVLNVVKVLSSVPLFKLKKWANILGGQFKHIKPYIKRNRIDHTINFDQLTAQNLSQAIDNARKIWLINMPLFKKIILGILVFPLGFVVCALQIEFWLHLCFRVSFIRRILNSYLSFQFDTIANAWNLNPQQLNSNLAQQPANA